MWLPETAVDMETLDILAEYGIKFTILSPHQAKRVRGIGGGHWMNIEKDKIDTTRPYLCRLASGRTINLFFYHGPIASAVAGGHILQNGEVLAKKLNWSLTESSTEHRLAQSPQTARHSAITTVTLIWALAYLSSLH
jgi:hypothetical protein